MATKISLKKEITKKQRNIVNVQESDTIDISEESIASRAMQRQALPPVSYVNQYQTRKRRIDGFCQINLTELIEKHPHNKRIIDQFIIGANALLYPGVNENTVNVLFEGLKYFIEFLNSNRNLSNIDVINMSDINITVAQSFRNYLQSVYPKHTKKSRWYNTVIRIIKHLQKLYPENPDIGHGNIWPKGPRHNIKKIKGYLPRQMEQLWKACIEDIDNIMNFHETYLKLEEELYEDDWNLENIMYLLKTRWESPAIVKYTAPSPTRVYYILGRNYPKKVEELFLKGYTYEKLYNIFMHNGSELASHGRLPTRTRIVQKPNKERAKIQFNLALATLKKRFPLFPYYYSIDLARDLLSKCHFRNLTNNTLCPMINKIVFWSSTKIEFMKGTLGKNAVYAASHFVKDTLYPFLLLCLINTGWNVESILSISDNVDSHITPDLIDPENYVLIHGDKVRGSSGKKPISITHRSSKKKKYSTYRLLKYVESVITQYKDSPYYKQGFLWQYTMDLDKTTLINTFNEQFSLFNVSERFVKRHEFKAFPDGSISHPKIRSGYAALRQLLGSTEWDIGEDFCHKNTETIIHYTSDESSNIVQDMVIKQIQNQFVNDLLNFKFRIIESQSLQELRKAINDVKTEFERNKLIRNQAVKLGLDDKTILKIIDAGAEKYILVCEDCTKPTWPGFNEYIKDGQKCKYFNKCALCTQSIVFPEALPYIARRILDLEKLKSSIVSFEWILLYGDEFDAWNQILSCWSNKKQVDDAWKLAKLGLVELPQIMRGA